AGMGYFALFMNLAMVIGPFLGLTIIQYTSFNMLFIITSFFSLFAVISGFIPSLPKKQDEPQRDASTSSRDKKWLELDRKSTRLNSSHVSISYAVFCF